jgi:hypothetical protein
MTTPNLGLALAAGPDTIAQALITKFDANFSTLDTVIGNKVDKGAPIVNLITTTAVAGGVPLVAKGILLQSGNLFEARNNVDTVLAYIDSLGTIAGASIAGTVLRLVNDTPSNAVARIKGVAAQSANLLELQNSGGTNLTTVPAGGGLNIITGALMATASATAHMLGSGTQDANAILTIMGSNASAKVLVLKGAAAQSANVQEWAASDGSILVRSRPTGAFEFNYGLYTQGPINNTPASGHIQIDNTQTNGATTALGLLIIGRAAQSANLVEVRNSSGTPIFSVGSTGGATLANLLALAAVNDVGSATAGSIPSPGNYTGFVQVQIGATVRRIPYFT